jgi:hypothetical protein
MPTVKLITRIFEVQKSDPLVERAQALRQAMLDRDCYGAGVLLGAIPIELAGAAPTRLPPPSALLESAVSLRPRTLPPAGMMQTFSCGYSMSWW